MKKTRRSRLPKIDARSFRFYAVLIALFSLLSGIERLFTTHYSISSEPMADSANPTAFGSLAPVALESGEEALALPEARAGRAETSADPRGFASSNARATCGRKCRFLAAVDAETAFLVQRGAERTALGGRIRAARDYYLTELQ